MGEKEIRNDVESSKEDLQKIKPFIRELKWADETGALKVKVKQAYNGEVYEIKDGLSLLRKDIKRRPLYRFLNKNNWFTNLLDRVKKYFWPPVKENDKGIEEVRLLKNPDMSGLYMLNEDDKLRDEYYNRLKSGESRHQLKKEFLSKYGQIKG